MSSIETIVVGTDLTERSHAGLQAAADLATLVGAKRLHLVHVVDLPLRSTVLGLPYALPAGVVDALSDSLIEEANKRLEKLEVPNTTAEVTRQAAFGIPTAELTKIAEDVDADLILVTSRGLKGVARFVLGSLANSLIRSAHCPVLVLREGEKLESFETIVAGVDLSPVSERVLDQAMSLAEPKGGLVSVVSCFEHPLIMDAASSMHPKEVFEDLEERHRAAVDGLVEATRKPGVKVDVEVMEKSPPAQVLVDVVQMTQPDLAVVGTSGRNAWKRALLGSTASRMIAEAPCPVLVVPNDSEGSSKGSGD